MKARLSPASPGDRPVNNHAGGETLCGASVAFAISIGLGVLSFGHPDRTVEGRYEPVAAKGLSSLCARSPDFGVLELIWKNRRALGAPNSGFF